jgi:putative ABC transport system permease protein
MIQDLKHAFRQLFKAPGFSVVAIATLGLGIAGNATVASLLDTLFFQPLPVPEPDRLVGIYTDDFSHGEYGASSYPDYLDMGVGLPSLSGLTGVSLQPTSVSREGSESQRILASFVAGDYFRVLQVPLQVGRGFTSEEMQVGGPPAVVLSHGLWMTLFGGDTGVVGQTIKLGGEPFMVVGVAAPGYRGLLRGVTEEVWVPFSMDAVLRPGSDAFTSRGDRGTLLYGRLRPGATLAGLRAETAVFATRMFAEHPDFWRNIKGAGRSITVLPESEIRVLPMIKGTVLGAGALLAVVVALVLLIACANLANLVMARTAARGREFAVRLALGASRGRLVRQLLVENLVLAGLGGTAGMALSVWLTAAIGRYRPPLPVPIQLDAHLDLRVFLFVAVVACLTGCLVGLAPALAVSRPSLLPSLQDASPAGGSHRSRLRSLFVVLQVGLSLVLLIGAGLFLRSLREATAIDPGFGARRGLLLTLDLGLNRYSHERVMQFQSELRERVGALPGVTAVALTSVMPLSLMGGRRSINVEGYQKATGEDMEVPWSNVSDGYFEVLEVPLATGRGFTAADRDGSAGVAVVNESFVKKYWPGSDGLTHRVSIRGAEGPYLDVVGVARDGKYQSLGDSPTPFLYLPLNQTGSEQFTLVARSGVDPAALVAPVRAVVRGLDPSLPIDGVSTLDEHIGVSLLPARIAGAVLGLLGLLGLILASLGVAGVVAFGVSQRVREIGIRMALGARGGEVVGMMVMDAMRLVAIGVAMGIVLALPLAVLTRGFLYGLSPLDPTTYVMVPLGLVLLTLVAGWVPARRAARVEPMVALRSE